MTARAFFLLLLALLLAPPALAGWSSSPAGTDKSCEETGGTAPNPSTRPVCYYNGSDTTDTPVLNTTSCGTTSWRLNAQVDGTNTDVEGFIRGCVGTTATANECDKVLDDRGNVAMDGDSTTHTNAMYGVDETYAYFDVTANANSRSFRLRVKCGGAKP